MERPQAPTPVQLEIAFRTEGSVPADDPRSLARVLEDYCERESLLANHYQRVIKPTPEGTLGGTWEGTLAFFFTHLEQVRVLCQVLVTAAKELAGRRTLQFSLTVHSGGNEIHFESKGADLKDVNKISKQIIKLCKELPATPS